jgi:dTDP-4-dehydrorhamnose 3,5-epimerase
MPFKFSLLEIPGLVLVQTQTFGDNRGFFSELYKHSDFVREGIREHFVQDNYSKSAKGVLRGLHYQKFPAAQGKLIMCMRGRIWDIVVDIRKGSPFYGKWISKELTDENRLMLYVPPGFAHGFQVLSDAAEILYKCTDEYSPANDRGIIWNDPVINIAWPIKDPVLSDKDIAHPTLHDSDNNFIF